MKFNLLVEKGVWSGGDQVSDLRDQIESLGHEFTAQYDRFMPPPWFNLFCEGTIGAPSARLAKLHEAGYQTVLLVTEKPTLVTSEGLVWNYHTGSDSDDWARRANEFYASAPYISAAWCYVPQSTEAIRRFIPRVAEIDVAWGSRFLKPKDIEPRYDFCFFGSATERRIRVMKALSRQGFSVDIIPHASVLDDRDARIPHSKVVLDIKQHHWWDLVSSMRYVVALGQGRPVVAEHREIQGEWAKIVRFCKDGEFIANAISMLENWQAEYVRQLAALKAKPDTMAAAIAVLPEPNTEVKEIPEGLSSGIS